MRDALLGLIGGFRLSQMIATVAKLRIADHLRDGPQTARALARLTGSDPDALYRVLRALSSIGVFAEDGPDLFRLTAMGEWLRSDVPGSVRATAEVVGEEWMWRPWGALAHTITTGETAFDALYGQDTWTWFGEHPAAARLFDRVMDEITLADAEPILAGFDFGAHRTIVDIAGGRGVLLAEILRRHPGTRGVLFNVPAVVESARLTIPPAVRDRIEFASGDFFRSVPAGGDVYILKNILHDWADDEAAQILIACRVAMAPHARLLIIEHLIGAPNERCAGTVGDIQMMVRTGGRNRSITELTHLLTGAGFPRPVAYATAGGPDVLVVAGADDQL
jgi:hypothetical protein